MIKCHCTVVTEMSKDVADSTLTNSCMCGCSGGACIPQREYERQRIHPLSQSDLQEMVLFSVNGKCGYPLVDALRKQYRGLDGRDDKMFVDFKSSISLRLEVRPPAQRDPMVELIPVCSGSRMRSGQGRSVLSLSFRCTNANDSQDSNVDLAEGLRSHRPRKARYRGGEENEILLRGNI